MPTVSDFCSFLRQFAPEQLAESWDNTGLLIGRQSADVSKVMTCLTLTADVAAEAVQQCVQLIVTHHPVLFRGTKQLSDQSTEGRMLLELIESKIAVYSPHTSFDSAPEGINQQLAVAFGLQNIQPLRPSPLDPSAGSGRAGTLARNLPLSDFLAVVGNAVRADRLEYAGQCDAVVRKIAIGCGAAEDFLKHANELGCDTFVTGEARFHTALAARSMGISLVLTGHYYSERPAVEVLAGILGSQFPEVEVISSRADTNPLKLFIVNA